MDIKIFLIVLFTITQAKTINIVSDEPLEGDDLKTQCFLDARQEICRSFPDTKDCLKTINLKISATNICLKSICSKLPEYCNYKEIQNLQVILSFLIIFVL